jgi:hypothetical protein
MHGIYHRHLTIQKHLERKDPLPGSYRALHCLLNPFACPFSTRYCEDPLFFYYSNYPHQMLALCVGVKLSWALEMHEPRG